MPANENGVEHSRWTPVGEELEQTRVRIAEIDAKIEAGEFYTLREWGELLPQDRRSDYAIVCSLGQLTTHLDQRVI